MIGVGAGAVIGLTTEGTKVVFNAFLRFGLIVGFALGVGWAAGFLSIRSLDLGMTSLSSGRFLEGD